MQSIIRSKFSHSTVIMIAHRLESIMDFDVVAVMDKGRLIEVGNPRELVGCTQSTFARMYQANPGSGIRD